MPAKSKTFPELRLIMVSFDHLPDDTQSLMRGACRDISQVRAGAKYRKAISQSNAFRVVSRTENLIVTEFLYRDGQAEPQVRLRFIYELAPGFR